MEKLYTVKVIGNDNLLLQSIPRFKSKKELAKYLRIIGITDLVNPEDQYELLSYYKLHFYSLPALLEHLTYEDL